MKKPNQAAIARAHERRAKVATLYLKGVTTLRHIALRLGMDGAPKDVSTIFNDLKKIRQAWKQSYVRDFDLAKAEHLAKLDTIIAELWTAWEESGKEKVSTRERLREQDGGKKKKGNGAEVVFAEQTKIRRDPNHNYMVLILKAMEQQALLYGLVAKGKSDDGEITCPPILGFKIVGEEEESEPIPDNMPSETESPPPAAAAG